MDRILVIRFSSIGDIVLTAPVIAALREQYPEAEIDYLVHNHFAPIVEHFNPPPDNIIGFDAGMDGRKLSQFARGLAKNNYNLVIDLHNSLRSKLIRKYLRNSESRTYRKPRLNRWLLFYLCINRFPNNFDVVSQYLTYAGIDPSSKYLPSMKIDDEATSTVLRSHRINEPYLVCIPGAAWPQKSWPAERYSDAINRSLNNGIERVVLLGGPNDMIVDEIYDGLDPGRVSNLRGRTNLAESFSIIAGAKITLGADTGLVHASEALGVPVVMILGPTSVETGAKCHHPDSIMLEKSLWCRPCSQNGKRKCYRKEQYCMTEIGVEQVAAEIGLLWGAR